MRAMEEILDIFDENMKYLGKLERSKIHSQGIWHRTFQCWFFSEIDNKIFIIFQKRNAQKETFPNLYDITSSGHLSSGEEPEDGIREIEEELGVKLLFEELKPVAILRQEMVGPTFIDREFCHTFIYKSSLSIEDFKPQLEELSGIFMAELMEFHDLILNKSKTIKLIGYNIDAAGNRNNTEIFANYKDFVPHSDSYYLKVLEAVNEYCGIINSR